MNDEILTLKGVAKYLKLALSKEGYRPVDIERDTEKIWEK